MGWCEDIDQCPRCGSEDLYIDENFQIVCGECGYETGEYDISSYDYSEGGNLRDGCIYDPEDEI